MSDILRGYFLFALMLWGAIRSMKQHNYFIGSLYVSSLVFITLSWFVDIYIFYFM